MDNCLIKTYAEIQSVELKWLWYPYIPLGKITLLQGDPGEGKSSFAIQLASIISNGALLPDGITTAQKGVVIYQCAEDNLFDTIKPRLEQANANCENVYFIKDPDMNLSIIDKRVEEAVKTSFANLLIIDPIQAYIPEDGDMLSATHMRASMRRLAMVAEKYECAILIIGHMNKASGGKNIYRGLGSIDIAAIARSILMIERDCNEPCIRKLFPVKSNLSAEGATIAFKMKHGKGIEWLGKIDENVKIVKPDTKLNTAKIKLFSLLVNGEKTTTDILSFFENQGIRERTVRTAGKEIGVTVFKKGAKWYWALPNHGESNGEEI